MESLAQSNSRRRYRRGKVNILSLTGIVCCSAAVAAIGLVVGVGMDLPDAIKQSRNARIAEARGVMEASEASARASTPQQVIIERRVETVASTVPEPQPTVIEQPVQTPTEPPKQTPVDEPPPAPAPRIPIVDSVPSVPVVEPLTSAAPAPRIPIIDSNGRVVSAPDSGDHGLFRNLIDGLTLSAGTKATAVAKLALPKDAKLTLELLSPELNRGEGIRYTIKPDGSSDKAWLIEAETVKKKQAAPTPPMSIAKLEYTATELRFAWLPNVAPNIAEGLQGCGMRLHAGEESGIVALRPVETHKPLELDFTRDSMSVRVPCEKWDADGMSLYLEATGLDGAAGLGMGMVQPSSRRAKLGEPLHVYLSQGDPTIELRLTLFQRAAGVELKVEPLITVGATKPAAFTKARVDRLARTYGAQYLKDSFDQFSENATLSFRVFYLQRKSEAEILRYGERESGGSRPLGF